VTVESSERLIRQVQRNVNWRASELAAKGKTVEVKPPQVSQKLAGTQPWSIRPIDLLRKLGEMTTPPFLPLEKMPRLSASWATRRYFWAIEPVPAGSSSPFRLSSEARELDFHQKTLLSDEFGIGMAGLLMEQQLGAANNLDTSYALRAPGSFQDISLNSAASPDYLMWGSGKTYYVVECKGCQTTKSVAINQIRRGLEQVVSVNFGSGPYTSETMVVSTFLGRTSTRLFVVDPPEDEEPQGRTPPKRRVVRIEDPEGFARRASLQNQARLLVWAGLYESAAKISHELEIPISAFAGFERPRALRETPAGKYEGTFSPLFAELGNGALKIFTGVLPELLNPPSASQSRHGPARPERGQEKRGDHAPFNMSFGRNGTCMVVDGL